MDQRLDEQIIEFNKRYQDAVFSNERLLQEKKNRYLTNIKQFKLLNVIDDLKYRSISINQFSTKGNCISAAKAPYKTEEKKIAVYSCIVGSYDKIIEPVICDEGVDYFLFTDQEVPKNSVWKKIDVTQYEDYSKLTPIELNRKIKILPYEYLPDYDVSVYIDGNIECVAYITPILDDLGGAGFGVHYHSRRDCIYDEAIAVKHYINIMTEETKEQLKVYAREGFPRHYGLYENSILVRKHDDREIRQLMELWWEEYQKYPTRDQYSLPYVVWKMNLREKILILGNDISRNPRFNRINKHMVNNGR